MRNMKSPKEIVKRVIRYINDSSINVSDRAFILFSSLVLIAIFLAVPFGLIMREPPIATISTLIGDIFFTSYVVHSVKAKKIARAKIVISVILVFIFMPAMFFTNGGVEGGAPIWLLLGTIYIALVLDGRLKIFMIIATCVITTVCWLVGYFFPQFVTEYSRGGNYFDCIVALFIVGAIVYMLITFQNNLYRKDEEYKNIHRLFEQTATALVNAIDAKDEYTHGHSSRVAEYSRKIAEYSGMSKEECEEVYYAALLHDVGKIGIPGDIINKAGKLTDEEYEKIKKHPALGAQILRSITEFPSLSIGANFHHERYDGRGYPEKLTGEDIPRYARIISVADAYDAMTSKRSYRETIPQSAVREEIVKGAGTQFDPEYAKIMQHLIDLDSEYTMKEKAGVRELAGKSDLVFKEYRDEISDGFLLTDQMLRIRFNCESLDKKNKNAMPALIVYDAHDGRFHDSPREMRELCYFEYAELWFDGRFSGEGVRKVQVDESASYRQGEMLTVKGNKIYDLSAVKYKDHVQIRLDDGEKAIIFTLALPDCSRYAYIAFAGIDCHLYDLNITHDSEKIQEDYIPRIAEMISYINGPVGDIPNVQVDGYRSAHSEAIPIRNGLKITFHTKCLPTARLIWHCPFLDIFYSDDKKPNGENFIEYALIRIDGENWEAMGTAKNKLIVNKDDDFDGWDVWKEANKNGFDCTVTFSRKDDQIVILTENYGIGIKNTTTIIEKRDDVYVALSGDQIAITNIRISYEKGDPSVEGSAEGN